jgi:hypothetical protein
LIRSRKLQKTNSRTTYKVDLALLELLTHCTYSQPRTYSFGSTLISVYQVLAHISTSRQHTGSRKAMADSAALMAREGHCVPYMTCQLVFWPPSKRAGVCWCRKCVREHVPGPYGQPGGDRLVFAGELCCTDSWLARNWFCRWCGRDGVTGSDKAALGIYGKRWAGRDGPSHCECGWPLLGWTKFNLSACGSCWWVCTQQLGSHLIHLLGAWSQIHETIWMYLLVPPQWGFPPENDARAMAWMVARIRDHSAITPLDAS